MKTNTVLTKTAVFFQPLKILKIILNRLNHRIADKNSKHHPQLAILSFDHIGLRINLDGKYEVESLKLVEAYIQEKLPTSHEQVVLDIGANIGNHSAFFSKHFKIVYSFEPNPIAYDILAVNSKHVAANKNIVPLNFGLSDQECDLPFSINPTNIGGSKINLHPKDITNNRKQTVIKVKTADTLEYLLKEPIGLIKIDVEGHELSALKGAEALIKKNKPSILFEQDIACVFNGKTQVISYLESIGYYFYTIKRRFDFGDSFFQKLFGHLLRSLLGDQLSFVRAEFFIKRSYDMILAVPADQ